MGNEMGNNNTTSSLNEEDNASEAEKKTFNEEVTAESNEEENQKISASKGGSDGETKSDGFASNETSKGDPLGDGEKGENQMEEAAEMDSDDAIIESGEDTLEEDSHANDDVKGPNQMIPMADDDAEKVEEKARGLTTVESTILFENHSSKSDTQGDVFLDTSVNETPTKGEDIIIMENQMSPAPAIHEVPIRRGDIVIVENQMPPAVYEARTRRGDIVIVQNQMPLAVHEVTTGRGDIVIVENQMPPAVEDEDGLNNDTSSASNDEPNVLENATQEGNNAGEDDENGDHQNHLSTKGEIFQEKPERIDLDDRTSELQDKTQKETHDNDEPGENAMDPISEDLAVVLGKAIPLSSDDQSDVKDSLSDSGHQITEIIQVEKSPNAGLEDRGGENCKTNSNFSWKSTEEFDKQIHQLVTSDHHLDKESSIKQEEENTVVLTSHNVVELQESSQIHSFHDEFEVLQEPSLQGSNESLQRSDHLPDTDTLPLMDDDDDDISSDKEKETQENMLLLAEVNHITDHSLDSSPESEMVMDKKMCKELQEERKLNLSGSEMENSQDFEADITIINRSSNGEGNIVLVSDQFDVCINNNNNITADEINSNAPVQQGFMVPEAEGDDELIPGSKVVSCRLEQEENYEEKVLEEVEKKTEASEQRNSHPLTSGQKESNTQQNSSTILQASDSSNLTMPALDMVDNEAFEKEAKDYSRRAEATTLKEAEITTSEANPVIANGGYEVMESIATRYSTESNPENPNICCLMQKSPSFNLNLRIEATTKEEYLDHIPLLHYQGKTATESLSNQNGLNGKPCAEYEQGIVLQYEEMPVEEKIVTTERSYSDNSHAPPFLGLLKEEEEAHLLVMPKKQENEDDTSVKEVKELEYALPNKGKEKHKPSRPSSFFSSCMCCMTLTN